MNGTRNVHVLIDGASLGADNSLNKILREPLTDIHSVTSTVIPAMKPRNGRESYYRLV